MTREIDWSRSLKRNLHTWRGSKRRPKTVKSIPILSPEEYRRQWPFKGIIPTLEKAWMVDSKTEKETVREYAKQFRDTFEVEIEDAQEHPDPLLDAIAFYCFDIVYTATPEKQYPKTWFQAGLAHTLEVVYRWPEAMPIVRSESRQSSSLINVEGLQRDVLERIRRQLVSLKDKEHEELLVRARELFESSETPLSTKVHLCYLFPGQTEWGNSIIDALPRLSKSVFSYSPAVTDRAYLHLLLFASGADFEHITKLAELCNPFEEGEDIPDKVTLQYHFKQGFTSFYATLDRFELEAKRPLLEFLKLPWSHPPMILVDVLCNIPDEEVVTTLVERWKPGWVLVPSLRDLLIDNPVSALAALDAAKQRSNDGTSLGKALDQVYEELQQVEKRLEAEASDDVHFATRDDLEGVLANPPWHGQAKKKSSKGKKVPKSLEDLDVLDDTVSMVDLDRIESTRRDRELYATHQDYDAPNNRWKLDKRNSVLAYVAGESETIPPIDALTYVSLETADAMIEKLPLDHFEGMYTWEIGSISEWLSVRPELYKRWILTCKKKDGISHISRQVRWSGLAEPMSELLGTKTMREKALLWIENNPRDAAIGAIPAYFKTRGAKKKANLEEMLRVARATDTKTFEEVVQGYGDEVAEHLPSFDDATTAYPKKMPKLPSFWNPAAYPPILLEKDLSKKLPVDICDDIALMLKFSPPGKAYIGLTQLAEQADDTSLGQFTWGLFESWIAAKCPTNEEWVIQALGLFGGPQVADELPYLLDEWLRTNYYKRGEKIIESFAEGANAYTFEALWRFIHGGHELDAVEMAKSKVLEISGMPDTDAATVFDRVAPTFGIGKDRILALGGRSDIKVWLDEDLEPHLEGIEVTELDESLQLRWERLGKLCARQARFQSQRFERAMRQRRIWRTQDWRKDVLEHPLLGMLAHRLLWGVYDSEDALVSTFRVDETGGLVDIEDEVFTLTDAPGRNIQLVHPVQLSEDELTAWSTVFTDYEVIQPFEQLSRPTWSVEEALEAIDGHFSQLHSTYGAVQMLYEGHDWRGSRRRKRTHADKTIQRPLRFGKRDLTDPNKNSTVSIEIKITSDINSNRSRFVPGTKPDNTGSCVLWVKRRWRHTPNELSPVDMSELIWELAKAKDSGED